MRLLPIKDRTGLALIKGQWKKDTEVAGEDFASFGGIAAFDAVASKEGDNHVLIAFPMVSGFMPSARSGAC